jgi:hypothetical protein
LATLVNLESLNLIIGYNFRSNFILFILKNKSEHVRGDREVIDYNNTLKVFKNLTTAVLDLRQIL